MQAAQVPMQRTVRDEVLLFIREVYVAPLQSIQYLLMKLVIIIKSCSTIFI